MKNSRWKRVVVTLVWFVAALVIVVLSAFPEGGQMLLAQLKRHPEVGCQAPEIPRLQVAMWTSDGTIIAEEPLRYGSSRLLAASTDGAVREIAVVSSPIDAIAEGPLANEITYVARDNYNGPSTIRIMTLDGKVRASRKLERDGTAVFAGWKDGKLVVLENTREPHTAYGYGWVFSSDLAQQRKLPFPGLRWAYSAQFSPLKNGHIIIRGRLNKRGAFLDGDLATGKVELIAVDSGRGNWRCYDSGRLYFQTQSGLWAMDPTTGITKVLMPGYSIGNWELSWDQTREAALGVPWLKRGAFLIDPQAKRAKRFADIDDRTHPVLSPDGSSAAYIRSWTEFVLLRRNGSQTMLYKIKDIGKRVVM
jgi:hypothetical protein